MKNSKPIQLSTNWRIATDPMQWHVQKRKKTKKGYDWKSLAFIGSNKEILLRCLQEKDAIIDKRGQTRLKKLPGTHKEWISQA
jgi:hypothetical protein